MQMSRSLIVGSVAAIAAAMIAASPVLAADVAVTPKPAATKVEAPAKIDAPTPLPRVRPAAIRLPASPVAVTWVSQRRPSSWFRVVSAVPSPRVSWSFYPVIHGVGF